MKRSKFSLSNYKLTTFDQGELIPVGLTEVLPGDTLQQSTSALIRLSPLVRPVMHPVHVRIHHWFVPHRLIWDEWDDFITGGPNGTSTPALPTWTVNPTEGSLHDYMGLPIGSSITFSMLPFRGYNLIWNEFYRDEDLQTALAIKLTSGSDSTTATDLQNVCWSKDYFTTARPWTQKGSEVTLPLGSTAPVERVTNAPAWDVYDAGTDTKHTGASVNITADTGGYIREEGGSQQFSLDPKTGLQADLSGASAASINDIREAFALQRYKEARARYGSRYTEYLRYLGVKSSDARLQRPEYLGGGRQTIQFSEVLQTGVDSTDAGVGNLKGHGISAMRSNRWRKFFEEHGYVFTLMSILPIPVYMQGIPKHFIKSTKEDFWQKELETIGQKEIENREVYSAHTTPTGTFGFQDRYDEYRRGVNCVSGEFRSTLKDWHMGREFTSDPALNATFVKSNPTTRIYASSSTDQIQVMAHNSIQARRLVRKTGTPGGV